MKKIDTSSEIWEIWFYSTTEFLDLEYVGLSFREIPENPLNKIKTVLA